MKKVNIFKRIAALTSIILIAFSGLIVVSAETPDIPDAVYEYFTDPELNYEEYDRLNNTNERCWVYKVFFQMNKDGSGYIDVFYIREDTDNNERTVEQHLSFIPSAKSYDTDHFQVYSKDAPWTIFACEVHIDDGLIVITDNTDYSEGSNPNPSPSPIPTHSPTPTVSPIPTVEAVTATPSPQQNIAPEPAITSSTEPFESPTATIEPAASPTSTPQVTPYATEVPIVTLEPTNNSTTENISEGIQGLDQQRNKVSWVLPVLFIILVIILVIVIIKYWKARQDERDFNYE